MLANPAAENVLGTIGAVCWSVQLIPQVIKSYRLKNTAGLSSWMLAIWFVGGIFLGAYVIVQDINIPLIVQPQCFMLLSAICLAQCLYYDQGRSKKIAIIVPTVACIVGGGLQVALIFGAKAAEKKGHNQVTKMCGIVSAIFIAGGLLPQYWEIYRFRAVVGISLVFLLVDLLGGIFSLLSLVFAEGEFDIIASLSYGIVVVLETGVFILAPILNPSYHRREALKHLSVTTSRPDDLNQDPEALSTRTPSMSVHSLASAATVELPEPESKEGKDEEENVEGSKTPTRGRSGKIKRSPLGWLDDALERSESCQGSRSRQSSMERELSSDRYNLARVDRRVEA